MKPYVRLVLVLSVFVLIAALVWLLLPHDSSVPAAQAQGKQEVSNEPAAGLEPKMTIPKGAGFTSEPSDPAEDFSPLAPELNSSQFSPQHDVDVLHTLLRQYLRRLGHREGLPIGNDTDLAKVLGGQNPMKYATLPPSHPALASDGRLRDRWGSPYFVHPIAEQTFEIRSAGPDRQLFTSDDLIADPTGGTAQ